MIRNIILIFLFPFFLNGQSAFISGNDTICDNAREAVIKIDFIGSSPFTFTYSINGSIQPVITTTVNPYIIQTKKEGLYSLHQYNDVNGIGVVSGSGLVTVLESPDAVIHLPSDTLSLIYPTSRFISKSIGNIISWSWDFGDNFISLLEDPYHTYAAVDSIYQVTLIINDDQDCLDTAYKMIYVRDLYWMYIPNTFSPDNDLLNDKFCIEFNGLLEGTFVFKVFNASGDLVFQSNNPEELRCSIDGGWDGSHYLTGDNISAIDLTGRDSYVFTMYYQDFDYWKYNQTGIINLVR